MINQVNSSAKKFCVFNCENSKAWSPIDFGDLFINCLKDQKSNDEWTTINVANDEPVPDALACQQFHGVIITGSHFNVRDGPQLSWFEPLCELIRRAALVGSPRIYAGCFGCQIVAHALKGSVDLNPTKRFVLKAETIEVVHDFREHLLFDCCSFSCCPTVPTATTVPIVPAAQQGELKEGLLVSEKRPSLLQYVTQGCCQTTSCCAEAPSSSTASSSYSSSSSSCSSSSSSSSSGNKDSSQPSHCTLESVCDVSDLGSEILQLSLEQKTDKKSTSQIVTLTSSCDGCMTESSEFCAENDGNTILTSDSTLCHSVQHNGNEICENENESDTAEDTADDSGKVGSYKLIVSHGDCVCVLPPESVLLGSSQTCTNEMYLTGKYRNIFACQSHPEFEYEYCIKERIWPAVTGTRKRLNDEEIKAAAESFENFNREDSKCLLSMIKSFLQLPCTFCTSCH